MIRVASQAAFARSMASSRTSLVFHKTRRAASAITSSTVFSNNTNKPHSAQRFYQATDADVLMRQKSTQTDSNKKSNGEATFEKVSVIGCGKMAQAIITPLIKTGLQPANKVAIFDVNVSAMKEVKNKHADVIFAQSIAEALEDAELVVCCVKPQNINEGFFNEVRKVKNKPPNAAFLSIIAGLPLSTFHATGYSKIIRSMPNTPAMIGRGMTVWCCTPNLTADDRDLIMKVLDCLGKTIFVDDERYVDMSTSISGSGPAYIFILMEAMIDAGVHMGFPRDKATTLVYHTLLGSTLFAMETGEHPAILRNNVTSPSGTTASALYELENGRFRTVIKDAMWACYRRSLEMGGKESNVGPGRAHTERVSSFGGQDSFGSKKF